MGAKHELALINKVPAGVRMSHDMKLVARPNNVHRENSTSMSPYRGRRVTTCTIDKILIWGDRKVGPAGLDTAVDDRLPMEHVKATGVGTNAKEAAIVGWGPVVRVLFLFVGRQVDLERARCASKQCTMTLVAISTVWHNHPICMSSPLQHVIFPLNS